MTVLVGVAVAGWQVLASIGYGAALLRLLRLHDALPWGERQAWSFALGFGCLGWILFFMGWLGLFHATPLSLVLLTGCVGLIHAERPQARGGQHLSWAERLLVAGIAIVALGDVVEALAPPVDADSLAYHFELPRRFLEAGGLFFVPRAVDGGIPLLSQLTYVPVLALGGEKAMTMWTGMSGWAAVALLYGLCRRHLDRLRSLMGSLLFACTPTVVYAAGSGQVEIRMALFAMTAAFAAAEAVRRRDGRWAMVAGIAAGFAAGSKYTGLLLIPAAGVACLMAPGWFQRGAMFTVGVLVAGTQWYAWNAINSGDPLYPMLYPLIGYPASGIWDAAHAELLKQTFFDPETPLPRSIWNFVAYPFVATLHGAPVMESGRTGFGPWSLLVLPMALWGAWRFRSRLAAHPLMPVTAFLLVLYTLWFFTGSSQRLRHLLPVYPLLLVCLLVAAARWSAAMSLPRPLMAACLVTLALQFLVQALYVLPFARHVASGESREAFFARSLLRYAAVPWINAHLSPESDRLALIQRQLLYSINVPTYILHPILQSLVDVSPTARDPALFARQLSAVGITHILTAQPQVSDGTMSEGGTDVLVTALEEAGCASEVYRVTTPLFGSRTLPSLNVGEELQRVLELHLAQCPLSR